MVRLKNVEGEDRIIDAVITSADNKQKIAIEFQESHKLDTERVKAKIKPILEAYDILIIVCSDQFKEVYSNADAKNLYVVNNAEFKSLLREWKLLK